MRCARGDEGLDRCDFQATPARKREVGATGLGHTRGEQRFGNGIPLSKIHHAAFDTHLMALMPTTDCTCRNVCSGSGMVHCSKR